MEEYKTQIRNNRDQGVSLRSPHNYVGAFIVIPPQSSRIIEFDDKDYFLTPFERITYKKSGRIDCVKRKGYKEPERAFPATSFLNSGGAELECIVLDSSETIQISKGIQIKRTVPIFSYYAEFSEVEILEPKMIPKPMMMSPGTIKYEKRPSFRLVKRSPADMKRLKEMRESAFLYSKGFRRG